MKKVLLLAISALFLLLSPVCASQGSEVTEAETIASIVQEVQQLKNEAEELKSQINGPSAMSIEDIWTKLQKLIDNADSLVDEIHLLSANVNSSVTLVSGELIKSISSLRDNINLISQSVSNLTKSVQGDLSSTLNEKLPKMLLTFNQDVSKVIFTIQESVDKLSATIERAIKDLSAAGIQQINAIGDKVGTLIVTVDRGVTGVETLVTNINDFAKDMSNRFGQVAMDMSVLVNSLKDAAIQHINLVSNNIVQIVQSIRQGVDNVSNVISAKINDIGDVVVGLIQNVSGLILEVKELVGQVGDGVNAVGSAVASLSRNTVDYLKQLDVEFVPRVYFGTFKDAEGRNYYADSGAYLTLKNLARNNPDHILEFGVETLDGKTSFSAMYARRFGDYTTMRLGYLRGQPAAGVSLGTASGNSEWLWEVGLMGSYRSKATLDVMTQFGKRNGLRGFFEVRDASNSERRYVGGFGVGIQF